MCDLIHPSIHASLQEFESYIALPVLGLLGLCTLQLVFCQSMQIATTVSEILNRRAKCKPKRPKNKCAGPSVIERIKGMFCSKPEKCKKPSKRACVDAPPAKPIYDDWDENYEDDEELDDELED